ncbi:hypothetical protein BH09BAC3_BH09BAC3_23400 [soil metagenome]
MRLSTALFLFIVSLFLLVACNSKKKEPLNTEVEIKNILAESMQGCNFDSMKCAQFEVSYPTFKGLDTAVQTVIMNRIIFNLNNGAIGEEAKLDEQGKEFIEEYNSFKSETPDLLGRWYRTISVEVLTFNDSLLSLQVSDESFEGGAHGSYNLSFVNVRPLDGSIVTLSNLLNTDYEKELNKIGEEIFRAARELADTASYEMNGYTFDDNTFALNENYAFRKEGIVFYYNSYEVAPYSLGPTEIVIPYERIKDWIKAYSSLTMQ